MLNQQTRQWAVETSAKLYPRKFRVSVIVALVTWVVQLIGADPRQPGKSSSSYILSLRYPLKETFSTHFLTLCWPQQFNTVLLAGTGSSSLSAATTQSSPGKRKRTTMNSLSAAATGFKTAPQPGSGVDSTLELMLQHMEVLRTCLLANLLNKSNFFHYLALSIVPSYQPYRLPSSFNSN